MSVPILARLHWLWLFPLVAVVAAASLMWTRPSAPPSAPPPPASVPADPARDEIFGLLGENAVLDAAWRQKARQWPAGQPLSDALKQATAEVWPQLLEDTEELALRAKPVLQIEQMARMREMLVPYRSSRSAEVARLAQEWVRILDGMLRQAGTQAAPELMPLTWANLQPVVAQLGRIQDIIRDLKKFSRTAASAEEPKLPMALFVQMSATFATFEVREFQTTANRLVQRRWALLYRLEKHRPDLSEKNSGNLYVPPPAPGWQGPLLLLLVGAVGTAFLLHLHRQGRRSDAREQQSRAELDRLTSRLHQLEQLALDQRAERETAVLELLGRLATDLSDMQGRIKTAQLRFDSGQMLDLATQDMAVVHEKLQHWQDILALPPGAPEPSKDAHV